MFSNLLGRDGRGVSPVIATVILLAIVIIVAGGLTVAVYQFGDTGSNPQPTAQYAFDYDEANTTLAIVHDGGETINTQNTEKLGVTGDYSATEYWGSKLDASDGDTEAKFSGELRVGDTIVTVGDESSSDTLNEVSLVWYSEQGDASQILTTWEKP